MKEMQKNHKALRGMAILWAVCLLGAAGCGSGKFFIPVCQAYNTCSGTGTGSGTGSGSGSSTYGSYAYVANSNIGTLAGFPVPTAAFTSISGKGYSLGATPIALAATPKGTFLYVAITAGSVFAYAIGTNGALTLANSGSPVTSTLNPTWMTVDPSGNWLFMVSNSSPQLLIFQINPSTGVLTQTSQGTVALDTGNPTQIYVTPNNKYVYVGLGSGGMDGFAFDSFSGTVSNQIHVRPLLNGASADNTIGADNKSAFLFVGEAGSGIRVLNIGTNGTLTEVSGSPFASQLGPKSIVVDPSNTYVYVANSTANVITGYTLGTSGTLTPLSSSPFTTGSQPSALSLDSTGKYLFVISYGGGPDLQVFSFDSTTGGKLDSVASVATGTDPAGAISLAVVP